MKVELGADLLSQMQEKNGKEKIGKENEEIFNLMLNNAVNETQGIEKKENPDGNLGITNSIVNINETQKYATTLMQDVLAGKSDDTHGALIALEKADMQFQLAVTVRDKMTQGVQSILNMQI